MTLLTQPTGKIVAVRGAVVDVAFEKAELPQLDEALVIDWDQPGVLIVEVQAHLDESTVRGVALQATAGLKRGVPVRATGHPITVPVGDAVLGRLLDIVGNARDNGHRCLPIWHACRSTDPPHRSKVEVRPPLYSKPASRSSIFWRHSRREERPPCSAAPVSARPS